jgi:hypothetical protein
MSDSYMAAHLNKKNLSPQQELVFRKESLISVVVVFFFILYGNWDRYTGNCSGFG